MRQQLSQDLEVREFNLQISGRTASENPRAGVSYVQGINTKEIMEFSELRVQLGAGETMQITYCTVRTLPFTE